MYEIKLFTAVLPEKKPAGKYNNTFSKGGIMERNMSAKRIFSAVSSFFIAAAMLSADAMAVNESHIIPYTAGYNEEEFPQNTLDSWFTAEPVEVDGIRDAAYDTAEPSDITHVKNTAEGYSTENGTAGKVWSVWNGPVLFLYAEIYDATPTDIIAEEGPTGENPAVPPQTDSVTFGIDFYNDKVVYETDTIGAFTIDANGALHYYRNDNIPSLGSVIADPIHPEYQNRLKAWAASPLSDDSGAYAGYGVEAAVQIEKLGIENDSVLGMEIQINDALQPEEKEEEETEAALETNPFAPPPGPESTVAANIFWSHDQDSLYDRINHSSPNCVDWGNLRLTGWNGSDAFAFSDWRLTDAVRYLDSAAFPKDVYTKETQDKLDEARKTAEALLAEGSTDAEAVLQAADALEAAIAGLRWADTRYPDPADLPDVMTLPDPWKFFYSGRIVKTAEDWEERRAEILDLAQFYEYGYKPDAPEKAEITAITHYNIGDVRNILLWGFWPMDVEVTCPTDVAILTVTDGGVSADLEFTVYLPTEEQLETAGRSGEKAPVILSFDGDNETYRNAGFAVVQVPQGSSGDVRTNEYAWGTRGDAFYELYPYGRNGEAALHEVSSEMAAAWSASRIIDALENIASCELEGAADIAGAIDPEMLTVTGFSINGKYAFVSAVFDERIDVCIPGAAGASGPSPWRYVYTGHEYDWTGTPYAPAEGASASAQQTAFGTEVLANSIRHNRVRETELFRHFLTPFNFYKRLPGAWGFGTRLPYDQTDLIATLAPRAIILMNTVNDCNDGSEADSLGLQIARSVYRALGYDADELVRFNQRPVQEGEPHGSDEAQYSRNAAWLSHHFFGTELEEAVDTWLSTDPFSLPVCNGGTESPYDFYYGGYNTITGGTGGVDGRDGWYYYSLEETP